MKNISTWLLGIALGATLHLHAQERPLSLDEALTKAKENNKALKVEYLKTRSAHEETRISKASMLPTVSASGGYSYYFDRQVIFLPGAFTGNENEPVVDLAVGGKNTFNTYLSLQQPLLSEPARRQIKSSKINESIQELHLLEESSNLILDVAGTYYRALLIQESIELHKQSLTRNLRSLDDSRMLLLQGKSLKIDTLRNHIIVENVKSTISHLETQRQIVMLQLRQLLSANGGETFILTDSLTDNIEPGYFATIESLYTHAIQMRQDIQIEKLNVALSENNLRLSQAQRLPTISLIGAYQIQAQADDTRLDAYRWPKTSFVGLQANLPLFSGNRINSRIRQSRIQFESSRLQMEDATDRANTEIATLTNNLKEMMQRFSIQERTVHAAEMNFRIVNDRYKNGLSSRLELSDAELALTEAKMNQLNMLFNVKIAKLQLDKALGVLR